MKLGPKLEKIWQHRKYEYMYNVDVQGPSIEIKPHKIKYEEF